jgi:hypothetical protein
LFCTKERKNLPNQSRTKQSVPLVTNEPLASMLEMHTARSRFTYAASWLIMRTRNKEEEEGDLKLNARFACGSVPDGKQPVGAHCCNQLDAMQKGATMDKPDHLVT